MSCAHDIQLTVYTLLGMCLAAHCKIVKLLFLSNQQHAAELLVNVCKLILYRSAWVFICKTADPMHCVKRSYCVMLCCN